MFFGFAIRHYVGARLVDRAPVSMAGNEDDGDEARGVCPNFLRLDHPVQQIAT